MVNLNSVAGKALVGVASGTTAPVTDGAREAARLFLLDVTQTLRWHAVAAGVALAATPIVYQLTRVIAQRYRAELVNTAKDAVQREAFVHGTEAGGVMVEPTDKSNFTISYKALSSARRRQGERHPQCVDGDGGAAAAPDGGANNNNGSSSGGSMTSRAASLMLAMRFGCFHAAAISFAHHALAAQRAPNVQFVRTCSRVAACQYGVMVLRACATSCVLCVTTLTVTYAGCTVLDKVVPIVPSRGSSDALPAAAISCECGTRLYAIAHHFFTAPLFNAAAPPSPSVGCSYGLYDFGMSASGVWSRLIPKFGAIQTLYQRLFGRLQPLHREWRDGIDFTLPQGAASVATAAHARADAVWAALTPRGYFVLSLLPRLPWRVLGGLQWVSTTASTAVLQRWRGVATSTTTTTPPRESATPQRQAPAQPRSHKTLTRAPLVKAVTLVSGDIFFAALVYAATLNVSNSGVGTRPLVRNAAGARYNVYCWVEAASSLMHLFFM